MNYQTTLDIQITLKSPLVTGTDREYPIFSETREYIPGGTLRGSLARLMREMGAEDDFDALFEVNVHDTPIFENVYVASEISSASPLPLSARTCKYHGGFSTNRHKKCHGIGDILIRQAVFEDVLLNQNALVPFLYQPLCPVCREDVDRPSTSFYKMISGTYHAASVPVRRQARTAINRKRYTAADQLLYTIETIEAGAITEGEQKPTIFRGKVHCTNSQKAILERWLPKINWVGSGRSRGLGQVVLKLVNGEHNPPLAERLAAFDEAVHQELAFYRRVANVAPPDKNKTHFFSLNLLSPAILSDCGVPSTDPDLSDLGLEAGNASVYRAFTDQETIGGWHLGQDRYRRTMLATSNGSVYLIQTSGLSLSDLEEKLKSIEIVGLGTERERGFGRVLISSPFHYKPEVTL